MPGGSGAQLLKGEGVKLAVASEAAGAFANSEAEAGSTAELELFT